MRISSARISNLLVCMSVALTLVGPASSNANAAKEAPKPLLKANKSQSAELYDIALARFQSHFNQPTLQVQLNKLASGQATISKKLASQLKVTRLSANILRSTFIMVDKSHTKPAALHRYVVLAGRLNDAISSGNKKAVPELAASVLKAMNQPAMQKEISGFKPASAKSVNGYLQASLRQVEKGLAAKTVSAPVFHQMRKDITYVQSLFNRGRSLEIGAPKKMDAKTQKLWNRLERIRNNMGGIHDKLAADKSHGKIDYDKTQVKIPKAIRTDIKKALVALSAHSKNHKKHSRRWRQNVSRMKRPGAKVKAKRTRVRAR